MPLDFQLQQYPFRLGLEEGTDPRQVPPGTLLTAENVEWAKTGQLRKRNGSAALTASIFEGSSLASAKRLFSRRGELCLSTGTALYAYSSTLAKWKTVDTAMPPGVEWTPVVDPTTGVMAVDSYETAAGILIVAWIQGDPGSAYSGSGALWCQVIDRSTGTTLLAPTILNSATNRLVRVLMLGSTPVIVSQNGTTIIAGSINLTTMVATTPGSIQANVKARGWDACIIGSTLVVAYEGSANGLLLSSFTLSGTTFSSVATGSISGEAGTDLYAISVDGTSGEDLYVAYYVQSSDLVRIGLADDATLTQTVAPATIEDLSALADSEGLHVGVTRTSASACVVAYTVTHNNNVTGFFETRTCTYEVSNAGTVATTSARGTFGCRLVCKPFSLGSKLYMACADVCDYFMQVGTADTVLLEVETTANSSTAWVPHRYVGRMRVLDGAIQVIGQVSKASLDGSAASFAAGFVGSTSTASPFTAGVRTQRTGADVVDMTVGSELPADHGRTVSLGSDTCVAGGVLCVYDGVRAFDYGFPRQAYIKLAQSGGAGTVLTGTYYYSSVDEFRSANGLLFRSVPGKQASTVLASAKDITVTIGTLGVTRKRPASETDWATVGTGAHRPLRAVYRTVVNGTTLQRLTIEPTYETTYSDVRSGYDQATDTSPDSSIDSSGIALSTRPTLYTAGGVLEDEQPPGCVTMFGHRERLWALAGDRRTWWYSKSFQDDLGVAPGFSTSFRLVMSEEQTGGASMDDKAVFFSASGVSYLLGDGPAPDGTGSDYGVSPVRIQTDVGCTNGRSIVSMPLGVMFESARGIYLLTRGLELVFVGRAVQDTLASFPDVTSAVLVPEKNQVRFTCNNSGGTAHTVLVYDYEEKQWTTFRYTHASTYGGGAIADACMWGSVYAYALSTGVVYYEDTATYLDASSTWVPITLKTAWISSAGPLAYQSVRRFSLVGSSVTAHDLSIAVGFDGAAASETHALVAGTSTAITVGGSEDPQITIGTRRKCSSIQFTITDATPTSGSVGTGQGATFSLMGLEVGAKRGLPAKPATKKG